MKIVYEELASIEDINQCIDMQRSLFKLSDVDIVSPLILQLIARGNPPMGITLGAFDESDGKRELIGFIFTMATFQERSIYGAMMGVKPQYQHQGFGLNLFLNLREIAIKRNVDYFYGVFEPLEKKLAHLYINHLGFTGTHYQKAAYYQHSTNEKEHVATDKILLKWDLKAFSTHDKNRNNSKELMAKYPFATKDNIPDSPYVLVEIPNDFSIMEKKDLAEAMYWRQCTKDIFMHYINQRNYIIYDCLSFEENQINKSFYLLKIQ